MLLVVKVGFNSWEDSRKNSTSDREVLGDEESSKSLITLIENSISFFYNKEIYTCIL